MYFNKFENQLKSFLLLPIKKDFRIFPVAQHTTFPHDLEDLIPFRLSPNEIRYRKFELSGLFFKILINFG